ncbi:MAG: alpha/beta hydrolase [Candidatus Dormibacteria bacterium]
MLRLAIELSGIQVDEVVLPLDRDVVVGGIRLHFLDWGGDGPPLVFLHGGGLNAHTFDLLALALRHTYRCLSIDQRGHGDSEWSPVVDYDPAAHARDLELFADDLDLGRFLLVGMSMGALNSIEFAGTHPDRLRGLVLIDAGPEPRSGASQRILDFMSEAPVFASVEELVQRSLRFNPRRDPRLLRRSLLNNLRRLPDGRWMWKHDHRQWTQDPADRMRRYAELWDFIPAIPCPTLVVRGAQSEVFLEEDARKLVSLLPNAHAVTVPNAGHTVQGDNPAGLLDVLLPFLKSLEDCEGSS